VTLSLCFPVQVGQKYEFYSVMLGLIVTSIILQVIFFLPLAWIKKRCCRNIEVEFDLLPGSERVKESRLSSEKVEFRR
jgi:hypothetical protein